MSLEERCERIRKIDIELERLFEELESLYYDDLTINEHNELFDMVWSDGLPHFC